MMKWDERDPVLFKHDGKVKMSRYMPWRHMEGEEV
jgi:hypothetical protein